MAQGFKFCDITEKTPDTFIFTKPLNDVSFPGFQANPDNQEYTRLRTYTTTYKWKIDSIEDILCRQNSIKSKVFRLLRNEDKRVCLELYTENSAPKGKKERKIENTTNTFKPLFDSSTQTFYKDNDVSTKKCLKMALITLQPEEGETLQVSVRYDVCNVMKPNERSVELVQESSDSNRYSNIIIDDLTKDGTLSLELFCKIRYGYVVTSQHAGPLDRSLLTARENVELLVGSEGFASPDFAFVCGNRKINVHKCVLDKQSAAFTAMVQKNMKEGITNEVEIEGASYETMLEVVKYMYIGLLGDKLLPELLNVAEKYNLNKLKSICEERLYNNLVVENAMESLYWADMCSAEQLEKRVLLFIAMNKDAVTKTEGYKNYSKASSILSKIINFL